MDDPLQAYLNEKLRQGVLKATAEIDQFRTLVQELMRTEPEKMTYLLSQIVQRRNEGDPVESMIAALAHVAFLEIARPIAEEEIDGGEEGDDVQPG